MSLAILILFLVVFRWCRRKTSAEREEVRESADFGATGGVRPQSLRPGESRLEAAAAAPAARTQHLRDVLVDRGDAVQLGSPALFRRPSQRRDSAGPPMIGVPTVRQSRLRASSQSSEMGSAAQQSSSESAEHLVLCDRVLEPTGMLEDASAR